MTTTTTARTPAPTTAAQRAAAEHENLLQDIRVASLQALPRFRQECPESTFVWRVAHNSAQLHVRCRLPTVAREGHDEVIDDAPSAHESSSAIKRSSTRSKRCPRTNASSHDDISVVVGVSTNAVGVRLHRARALLSQHLVGTTAAPAWRRA